MRFDKVRQGMLGFGLESVRNLPVSHHVWVLKHLVEAADVALASCSQVETFRLDGCDWVVRHRLSCLDPFWSC